MASFIHNYVSKLDNARCILDLSVSGRLSCFVLLLEDQEPESCGSVKDYTLQGTPLPAVEI